MGFSSEASSFVESIGSAATVGRASGAVDTSVSGASASETSSLGVVSVA